jgi:outer membrane protein OmpA-like peptidoglycan-associated protein/Tol biopolymer transport system component
MHSIRRILIFLALTPLLFSKTVFAQEQDKEQSKAYLEQAQLMLDAGSIALEDIRDVMIQAAEFDTTSVKANFEAGHLFLETINRDFATKFFMRVYRQKPDYRFDLEYWIGQSYQFGLSFDKALDFYNRYTVRLQKRPGAEGDDVVALNDVERRIAECQNGKEFVANPKNFSIVNIGREINSEFEDYAPVLNADETELVFTSRRRDGNMNDNVFKDNKPWEDIYMAEKNGSNWSPAKNLGAPVCTPTHESTLAVSVDGNTLFIYRDDGGGDIYVSNRSSGEWSAPEPLPGVINSSYNEASASISSDSKTLYFSSDRPGGLGGIDIYVCTKDGKGEWGRPRNLGPSINTEYDEDGPFIDFEGKTLYFSSMARKGMGGFDIFKASLLDAQKGTWSEPENLGYPINTPDDDVFFTSTKDGKRAYYSSVREDGMGYSDIYQITIPEDKPTVKAEPAKKEKLPVKYSVRVFDAATKAPLDAKVKLTAVNDNTVVGSANIRPGAFDFTIVSEETKDYRLSIELEGYVFQNVTVNIAGASEQNKNVTRTVELKKIAVGVSSILHNIYFDFNRATFKQESYAELSKLENMMKQNSAVRVEIAGHTDNWGPEYYNQRLSLQRATAVQNFLRSKGIDSKRVSATGFGAKRPLASNDDEADGRSINRRVEFKIISK